jgi:hypothetical protein
VLRWLSIEFWSGEYGPLTLEQAIERVLASNQSAEMQSLIIQRLMKRNPKNKSNRAAGPSTPPPRLQLEHDP